MFRIHFVIGLSLGIQFYLVRSHAILPVDDKIDLTIYGNDLYGPRDYNIEKVFQSVYNNHENDTNFNSDDINPDELGSYLEGDLLIPTDEEGDTYVLRNGKKISSSIWTGGLVPYIFDEDDHFERREIQAVLNVFDQFAAKTCIKFFPRTIEPDYIAFQKRRAGCFSSVGRIGGKQIINLSSWVCFKSGTTKHEIMHALGFHHEQKRHDRDKYIKINYKNMKSRSRKNFKKLSLINSNTYGIPYDYGSIIHYSSRQSSKNGKPTMEPLKKLRKGIKMGQRVDFSPYDLEKIRARYRCENMA